MLFARNYVIYEEKEPGEQLEKSIERKMLTSKLKSLNDHIKLLIQKKIRIDLEIRRTRKKITKLKQNSKTLVKLNVSLENLDYENLTSQDNRILLESWGPDKFKELYELDKQISLVEKTLELYKDLPLYED